MPHASEIIQYLSSTYFLIPQACAGVTDPPSLSGTILILALKACLVNSTLGWENSQFLGERYKTQRWAPKEGLKATLVLVPNRPRTFPRPCCWRWQSWWDSLWSLINHYYTTWWLKCAVLWRTEHPLCVWIHHCALYLDSTSLIFNMINIATMFFLKFRWWTLAWLQYQCQHAPDAMVI